MSGTLWAPSRRVCVLGHAAEWNILYWALRSWEYYDGQKTDKNRWIIDSCSHSAIWLGRHSITELVGRLWGGRGTWCVLMKVYNAITL